MEPADQSPSDSGQLLALDYWPAINAHYHQDFAQSSLLIQVLEGRGVINRPRLNSALAEVVSEQPLLNCTLVAAGDELALRKSAATTARIEEHAAAGEPLFAVAHRLLSRGIGEQLWRLFLVRSDATESWGLVLLCHHAIGDALSMATFMDAVLLRYSGSAASAEGEMPVPELPQNLEAGRRGSQMPEKCQNWAVDDWVPVGERTVGWLKTSLPAASWQSLQDACRREGVWPTGLITACLLRAAELRGAAALATAVDIRRRVAPPVPPGVFGCYAGVVESSVPWADDVWDHARATAASQIAARGVLLAPAPKGSILRLMMARRINQALEQGYFAGGCAVSNIGELPVATEYGDLRVLDVYAANRQVAGLYGVFLTTAVFAGRLNLNIAFAEPLLEHGRAERLLQELESQLQRLGGT